jgi:hypothetical protein
VKKYRLVVSILSVFVVVLVGFSACKKINESTNLGGDLIPAVDNVTTFEVALDAITQNKIYEDSTRVAYSDEVALGNLADPIFGNVWAGTVDFGITPAVVGTYPFVHKDSVTIDSVILSLGVTGFYGDSLSSLTFRVFEIANNSAFKGDSLYRYKDPASDFPTSGQLSVGSKTFSVQSLNDSITLIRARDTQKVANVVRIPINNSLGTRFIQYDTTNTANGGYRSDSIFKTLFKGLAVKADQTGNALGYFKLTDFAKTKLTVYYRVKNTTGKTDTTSFEYYHLGNGQSNYIKVTPSAEWATATNSPNPEKIYMQSSPSGAYAQIRIPALDTMKNKVIHRAEIVATVLPSLNDNIYSPPGRLFLDHKKTNNDTAFLFQADLAVNPDGTLGFDAFGGNLRGDKTYRLNITRYVQNLITQHASNDTLRLYAPYRTTVFVSNFGTSGAFLNIPVNLRVAEGRAVIASGTYTPDPSKRLRLRIIYSNL